MNSAINELIPAKVRGMVDLAINGTYWLGAMLGAGLTVFFLDTNRFLMDVGWRYPFAIASVLGIFVIVMRLFLPESPRWLILHGRHQEAEELVREIELKCVRSTQKALEVLFFPLGIVNADLPAACFRGNCRQERRHQRLPCNCW